mmetsp:Transcript_50/g.157  ORF Transcript_50/g.157 Transcript_50/m.157 type:complete len:278 (-) Transcript_50:77-910(-)
MDGASGDARYDITDAKVLRDIIGEVPELSAKRLKFTETLTDLQVEFISKSPFCLISTLDEKGVPCVSPKGDRPGFVRVPSPGLMVFPERPGNKLIYTLLNVLQHPMVQVIFLVPNTCETLRVSGRASLNSDPTLCREGAAGGQDALLVMRVEVTECYFHCAKALIRSQLWKPERWPAERIKVSFGKILARKAGKDAAWEEDFERGIAERYQAVADHYEGKVWAPARARAARIAGAPWPLWSSLASADVSALALAAGFGAAAGAAAVMVALRTGGGRR